jgi:enoyl-[acyl-carrier protein] reductase II
MKKLTNLWQKGKDFLGVEYPIISGGMTWISDYKLVKAVSNAGAFPVLAAGNMPIDLFEKELDLCINSLNKPFGVNLVTIAPNYSAHYELIKSKNVPFVIFAANFPKKKDIVEMKKTEKKTISFASTESIARQQIRFGIDALLLEGSEAGGHIGHVSLTILLQQVLLECRDTPIFVAGGIGRGEIITNLLLLGAYGCQLGTRFAMSTECTAHPKFKEAFIKANARSAISTPQYDSKLPVVAVRAINNLAMTKFGELQLDLLEKLNSGEITRHQAQYEVENFWMGSLRNAVVNGDIENGSLMAGQSVGLIKDIKSIKEIINDLIREANNELERVSLLIQSL